MIHLTPKQAFALAVFQDGVLTASEARRYLPKRAWKLLRQQPPRPKQPQR